MSSRIRTFSTFLLLIPTAVCTKENAPFPYALTFGTSTITASRFIPPGDIEMTIFPASNTYKTYFQDAVLHHGNRIMHQGEWHVLDDGELIPASPDTHDEDAAVRMFRQVIETVEFNLNATHGFQPTYAALSVSSAFNQSSISAASRALFPYGRLSKYVPKRLSNVANSAGSAYHLDRCEDRHAECVDQYAMIDLALVTELEKQYLHVNLVEVDAEYGVLGYLEQNQTREFGEESGKSLRETVGIEEYHRRVYEFLDGVVEEVLRWRYMPYRREHIRAIVLVGEASRTAFTEIRKVAQDVIGDEVVRVFDTIDPGLVVAHGAAIHARDTVLRPDLLGWRKEDFEREEHEHDEL